MTLTDPRQALADQSTFIDYLLALAGLAQAVRSLGDQRGDRAQPDCAPDDFVHLLLGIASLGATIERLGATATPPTPALDGSASPIAARWLR